MEDTTSPDEHPNKRVKLDDTQAELQDRIQTIQQQAVANQLAQEERFGVTAFASAGPGFSCVFKHRYTDFLVNEIEPSGKVVQLENVTLERNTTKSLRANGRGQTKAEAVSEEQSQPVKTTASNGVEESKSAGAPDEGVEVSISTEDTTNLETIFGVEAAAALVSLYGKILSHPGRKSRDHPQHTSEPIEDKQQRTEAHIAVRRIFNARIDTITLEDNRIHIKAASPVKQNARQPAQRGEGPRVKGKVGWDELGGEFLHFSLYKENKDTMEVLYFLASQMKMHTKNFQFAGTKDRRGVTVQRVSVFRVTKDRMINLNQRLRQARLSGFEHKSHGLDLGDLSGNEFTIVLRDCHAQSTSRDLNDSSAFQQTVSSAVDALKASGFLNYFGLQRFGSFSITTDEIGKFMLQGNLQGAVEGLLTYSDAALVEETDSDSTETKVSRDDRARAQALDLWKKSKKTGPVVEKLPRKFQAENAVIRHLGFTDKQSGQQRQLEDYQGALSQIPRNLRLMYVHAYQSRVWNTVAARRRELFGGKVVEGDLVIVKLEQNQAPAKTNGNQEEVDDEGEVIIRPTGADSATAVEDRYERARPLTGEEAASGTYTIFDVVLPMPGYDVAYPANAVGEYYKEVMGRDGLDPHDMRRKWKDISLSGSYRKVMAKAESVSFEIQNYTEEDEQLVLTDLDRLEGRESLPIGTGPRTAVILKLQLGSSQYATMALRELTKGGALAFKPDYSGR